MDSSHIATDHQPRSQGSGTGSKKKRPGACGRCRHRKVRCDGQLPICGNCQKAGADCDVQNASAQRESLIKRLRYLETLVQEDQLESEPGAEAGVSFNSSMVHMSLPAHHASSPTGSLGNSGHLNQVSNARQSVRVGVNLNRQPNVANPASLTVSDHVANVSVGPSPSGTETSAIGVQEPIAHEVGMLSLSNSVEPKYIGPSSGVTFARLLYAAVPESQGLAINASDSRQGNGQNPGLEQSDGALLPDLRDMRRFIDAYFETVHALYPFLEEGTFSNIAERIRRLPEEQTPSNIDGSASKVRPIDHIDHAQLFLVLFLGANFLETRLSQEFRSESYLATAMVHVSFVSLHESLRGLQTLILLTLSSLHSPRGLNAWFLKSTILAGCIDLGLQRKTVSGLTSSSLQEHRVRSGIFWSAYSLDRTLSVVLGRPLTLRDEALDVEFPDGLGSEEIDHEASHFYSTVEQPEHEPPSKKQRSGLSAESPAAYSFRFDRIFAEIKLMLYRVAQSPSRFPWPTDFDTWQARTHTALSNLLESSHRDLDRLDTPSRSRGYHDNTMVLIELKYHQAIMLLYRPSPAIPRPTALALKYCFESAVGALQAQSELQRFGGFTKSWLNAHTVFISGITICYCLWVSPQIRAVTASSTFAYYADTVKQLLTYLSTTWPVASSALQKFQGLIQLTESSLQLQMPEGVSQGDPSGSQTYVNDGSKSGPSMPPSGLSIDGDLDWSSFDVEYDSTNIWPQDMLEVPDWFSLANWSDDYGSTSLL